MADRALRRLPRGEFGHGADGQRAALAKDEHDAAGVARLLAAGERALAGVVATSDEGELLVDGEPWSTTGGARRGDEGYGSSW